MNMLWYKAWLETRWRFLIGLVVVICSAVATVLVYPHVLELIPLVPNAAGPIGEQIREAARIEREYRGYIWFQWYRQNLPQWATLFAIVIGSTSLRSPVFMLSLPLSRSRLLAIRTSAGLIEVFLLSFVPSVLISLISPSVAQHYAAAEGLIHSVCFFAVVSPFFALAVLLSTMFDDVWRPPLIAIGITIVVSIADRAINPPGLTLMSGESYFRFGHVPWLGLTAAAAIAAALYFAAVRNLAQREF